MNPGKNGEMMKWRHGDMATWRHGDMVTWRHCNKAEMAEGRLNFEESPVGGTCNDGCSRYWIYKYREVVI